MNPPKNISFHHLRSLDPRTEAGRSALRAQSEQSLRAWRQALKPRWATLAVARARFWLPLVAAWASGGLAYLHEPGPGEMLSAGFGMLLPAGAVSVLAWFVSRPYLELQALSTHEIARALDLRDKAGAAGQTYFEEVTAQRGLVRADLAAFRQLAQRG